MENGQAPATPPAETLFLEDTVQVDKGGQSIIGVVARTWHDIDDQEGWEDVDDSISGAHVSNRDFLQFKKTGMPPRHTLLFAPSQPEHRTMLVHECECTLLDRALAFGDIVKRSLTSPQSGTVTAVQTTVGIRHSFADLEEPPDVQAGEVADVLESELRFVNEWNEGDFVIYKNCWMGIVDEVQEDIAVRLENNSVVVVDQPADLEIPISIGEEMRESASPESKDASTPPAGAPAGAKRPPPAPRPRTVAPPTHLSPGQMVTTKKANLRRGRWLFGAYDASISPTGIVVEVRAVRIGVNWLCQNMMVPGRFIPVPRPEVWLEMEEDEVNLKRFRKSTGGVSHVDGTPFVAPGEMFGGGELQVGDRVCFADLDTAVAKYAGKVRKVPRSEALGFDLNTFIVTGTRTTVRVLWQDMTETTEDARKMVPYLNVDDHEVWPGEIVIMKPPVSDDAPKPVEVATQAPGSAAPQPANGGTREGIEEMWKAVSAATNPGGPPVVPPEFLRPDKVGVVQSVSPEDRVAKVKWFKHPNVEVAGGIMIPGSTTGELEEEVEDVSFYEAIAHQALGCRRGDFVLIAPERVVDEPQSAITASDAAPDSTTTVSAAGPASPEASEGTPQLAAMMEGLRGMVDGGLLSNLSAALGGSTSPQLQAVSRMLSTFPSILAEQQQQSAVAARPALAEHTDDAYMDHPPNWIAEVVDLCLDGLITVRLGALDKPVDIRVPIERLHIIFNDDMDLGDSEGEDGYSDEDGEDYTDDESEPDAIEERIIYEGGTRMDNGNEEDWLTDEDVEVDDSDRDGDDSDVEMADATAPPSARAQDSDTEMDARPAEAAPTSAPQNDGEAKPLMPPPIPDNVPAPEAFALSATTRAPPRFAVLDTPVPAEHAYAAQPPTPMSPAFARRIAKEHRILSTSLPEGILVRTWESRLDLLRVLIIGPLNTPYELAPFVFDFFFPPNFPVQPPLGHFHSWTGGVGRINPNLYEEGKICLSLLGTWHAERKGEGWSERGSSILQLLVSLMGLVLVREPWYNEAGFTVYQGAQEATLNSRLYSEKAYILARAFVKRVLTRPVAGFEKEIEWLYLPNPERPEPERSEEEKQGERKEEGKDEEGDEEEGEWGPGPELLKQVLEKAHEVVRRSEGAGTTEEVGTEGVGRVSAGALVLLKRDLKALEGILADETAKRRA